MANGDQLIRIGIAPADNLAGVEWLAGHPDHDGVHWSGPIERSFSLPREQAPLTGPCWEAVQWEDKGNASEQRQFTVVRMFKTDANTEAEALIACFEAELAEGGAHQWSGTLIIDRATHWDAETGAAVRWRRWTAANAVVQLVAGNTIGVSLLLSYVAQYGKLSAPSDYPPPAVRITEDGDTRTTEDGDRRVGEAVEA